MTRPLAWLFRVPEDCAAFCCACVIDGQDVLRVVHDADGDWQFLCGKPVHASPEPVVVSLGCQVARSPSLMELHDLPVGWCADRERVQSAWVRSSND